MHSGAALSKDQAFRIREVAARHGIARVQLFGSRAHGNARPDSDLDLLIQLEPGRGFRDLMDFSDEVEKSLAMQVDVVVEDGLSPFIKEQVLAEAVPLFPL